MRRRLIGGMLVLGAALAIGVKLRAAFDEAGRAMPAPEGWASLSERERDEFRRASRVRWEEHLKVLADIEEQVAVLKGPWQLRTELDEAIQELTAIRDLARQEKAVKAAERIQSLIDRRQAKHDQMVKKFGPLP